MGKFSKKDSPVENRLDRFKNLTITPRDGPPIVVTHEKPDPSMFGEMWRGGGVQRISWSYNKRSFKFEYNCAQVILDPQSDLLIILNPLSSDQLKSLCAFNPDATLNHVIEAPKLVLKGSYQPGAGWIEPKAKNNEEIIFPPHLNPWDGVKIPLIGMCYKTESISHIFIDSERVTIGIRFNREWCEDRYYDCQTRIWGERKQIYRL